MSEIWYIAKKWSNRIEELEVLGETDKFVKTKTGRTAKDCNGIHWIRKTRREAVEERLKYLRRKIEQADEQANQARKNLQSFHNAEASRLKENESASHEIDLVSDQ